MAALAQEAGRVSMQAIPSSVYEFQLEGEGYLMITRSDGLRAGADATTGGFVAEIPGAEQVLIEDGMGLSVPGIVRIPHQAGMTYAMRITDRPNAYGNASATANLIIYGDGFITRLVGLKIDSSEDPEAQPGANDVLGIVFDGDSHRVSFTASTLDSDTPALHMAVSQSDGSDYTFGVSGAQMASGRSISAAIDPATGSLVIENDDPANNGFALDVERINMDGSKTAYHFDALGDGMGAGTVVDLGPNWTGGAPAVTQIGEPVANDDSYETVSGAALAVAAPGVLGNDSGTSPLAAVLVSGPAHGTLALNADGSLSYTPAAGYVGPDSFTYVARSGPSDSDPATVSIVVTPYPFSGFFQPVDNVPTMNQVKAGQSIPIRFSVGGDRRAEHRGRGLPHIGQDRVRWRGARGCHRADDHGQRGPDLRCGQRPVHLCVEDAKELGGHVPPVHPAPGRWERAHRPVQVQVSSIRWRQTRHREEGTARPSPPRTTCIRADSRPGARAAPRAHSGRGTPASRAARAAARLPGGAGSLRRTGARRCACR